MEKQNIFIIIGVAAVLVGAFCTAYQIYKIVVLDAQARGFKHPKFWGLWAMNGNNNSGLLLYLVRRRNHPIIDMNAQTHKKIESRKKQAGVGLLFIVIGTIIAMSVMML